MNATLTQLRPALDIVGKQGWFSMLAPETQERLGKIAKLRTFAKNDQVFLVDDTPNGLFGLVSGSLYVSLPRGDGEDYTT